MWTTQDFDWLENGDCFRTNFHVERGSKISYFIFPTDKSQRKQWTHAIRRDEGKNVQISGSTKVCSRHFKTEDFQRSLSGSKINLKPGVVPTVFSWRTSPRKRKPPPFRHLVATGLDYISEAVSENEDNFELIEQPPSNGQLRLKTKYSKTKDLKQNVTL